MSARRGGGGGGGGNADSILRQGLRDLLARVERESDGGANGNARGGGGASGARNGSRGRDARGRNVSRDARPGGPGGAAGNSRLPQPGDWVCRGCQFSPNFARRGSCFRCKRPRSPRGGGRAAGGSGAANVNVARGPVGASGQRPLLGGRAGTASATGAARGQAEGPPSYRVPGASVAAAANAAASSGGNTWAGTVRGTATGGAATSPQLDKGSGRTPSGGGVSAGCIDEDGFQQVTRRGRKTSAAAAGDDSAQGGGRPTPTGAEDGCNGDHATGDTQAAEEGDGGEQPTAADLHQAWRDEIALIKKLRSQGVQDGHPAMRAAFEARDAAEHAWRSSKDPPPPAVRLGRAQAKLDRAIVLQSEAKQAILDEERGHRERMAALQATMDDCAERVALRRSQVQEIQAEVGAAGSQGAGVPRAQMEAIKLVHGTICDEVGPTLAALAEQVGTETPAWATLNSLLVKLASSKATLESAAAQPAARYHIGEEADKWESWTDWSESHDVQGQHWGQGDTGRDRDQHTDEAPNDDDHDESMGTGEWWDTPARRWGAASRWQSNGYGQWSRASWADQLEDEMGGDDDDVDGQPPTARRRLGGRTDNETPQPQPQTPHQPTPPAQQNSSAGEPSTSVAERQRKHSERVNHIVALAVEAGVTPLTSSGEELIMLGPEQLEEWVAECLPSALLC